MNIVTPRPFLPSDSTSRFAHEHEARRHPARTFLHRAAFAAARHAIGPYGTSREDTAGALWGGDDVTPLVLRAATAPATTTTSGWASQLATTAVGDFIASLVPISAAARVFDAALRVSLDGINSISFPYRSGAISASDVPWVAEGAPIPVGQFTLTSATLGPTHKLAIITVMTRETAEHGSGEAVLTTLMRENASLALDASLFGNAAGTADRPAGILNGIAALTGAANGDDAAMSSDLSALANAISTKTTGLAFVMHPAQANTARLRRGSTFPADIPIWSTLGVAEGVVIALDPLAIVSAFGAEPEITASTESVVHMDTAPVQFGVSGSPNVVAAPSRSLFQTDCVAVKLILREAWALRAPGAIAWIANTTW